MHRCGSRRVFDGAATGRGTWVAWRARGPRVPALRSHRCCLCGDRWSVGGTWRPRGHALRAPSHQLPIAVTPPLASFALPGVGGDFPMPPCDCAPRRRGLSVVPIPVDVGVLTRGHRSQPRPAGVRCASHSCDLPALLGCPPSHERPPPAPHGEVPQPPPARPQPRQSASAGSAGLSCAA